MADGGFDAPPPPVGGLGNFKGVMLCNRPSESVKQSGAGADGAGPFRSACSATEREQLGINPVRNMEPTVKTRGPSAALRRHVRWLRDLQKEMKDEREQYEAEEKDSDARKQKMKADFEKHRSAVKEMMVARDQEMQQTQQQADKTKKEELKMKKVEKKAKPMWAMTEEEKEDFEDEAAEDLINFAEGLDFDKFVGDLEFRQGLEALKDRTGKLKKEQEAFKEALVRDFNAAQGDEEQSTEAPGSPRNLEDGIEVTSIADSAASATSSRRRARAARLNGDGRPEWDSCTNAGDEKPMVDERLRDDAAVVLESNSQMRAVHSQASVAKMIEKAKAKAPTSLEQQMLDDGKVPAPVITASEDTQTRLHKPVDPSQLPYLYRSPAV